MVLSLFASSCGIVSDSTSPKDPVQADSTIEVAESDGSFTLSIDSGFELEASVDSGLASGDLIIEEVTTSDLRTAAHLGTMVRIETNADLDPLEPVQLRFPISGSVPVDKQLIAYFDEAAQRWWPVTTTVEGEFLVAETDHFSLWGTIVDVLDDAFDVGIDSLGEGASWLEYLAGLGLGNRASKPTCDGAVPAWLADFSTVDNNNAELFACIEGNESDQLVVKVVNNRGYPVTVEFNTPFASDPATALPRDLASAVLNISEQGVENDRRVFLLAGTEAVVVFDKPEGIAGVIDAHARRELGTVLGFIVFELLAVAGADLPIGNGKTLGLEAIECAIATYSGIEKTAEGLIDLAPDRLVSAINEFRDCISQVVTTELSRFTDFSQIPPRVVDDPTARSLQNASRLLLALNAADYAMDAADLLINDRPGSPADLVDLTLRWSTSAELADKMYAVSFNSDTGSTLWSVTADGDTLIGPALHLERPVQLTDLAHADDGDLLAVSFRELYRMSKTTGSLELIGPLGYDNVNALVRLPTGELRAASTEGELLAVDESTGQSTLIGSLGGGYSSSGDLAIGPDNQLLASVKDSSGTELLISIDGDRGSLNEVVAPMPADVWGLGTLDEELFGLTTSQGETLCPSGSLIRIATNGGVTEQRCLSFAPGGSTQ